MTVYEYVTADNGTVHLVLQHDLVPGRLKVPRTLCGRGIVGWTFGDETLACVAATCRSCVRIARPDLLPHMHGE